jgi:hypothetical protein
MRNQSYEIAEEIRNEMLVEALKQYVRANFPPEQAEDYCRQIDAAKIPAKILCKLLDHR